MSKLRNLAISGTLTGLNAYIALDNLLEVTNTKAIALQRQLALPNAPELTEQLYESVTQAADKLVRGEYILGLATAVAAGLSLGMCFYDAGKK